ncbi:MAG TPA: hypothetical protein VGE07_27175 [Herpetosiphonaceae bacterium]
MTPFCMTLLILLAFAGIVVIARQAWLDWHAGAPAATVQELYDQHLASLAEMDGTDMDGRR